MRIQNNFNTPTFKSKESLKRVCLETLDEFNQEFKYVKSPYKLFEESEKAKCPTKKDLYEKIAWIKNEKLYYLRKEIEHFLEEQKPSYEEFIEKALTLILKHKAANCDEMAQHYQYMLAKKGIYSELMRIKVYNKDEYEKIINPPMYKDHIYINVKNNEEQVNPFAADSWLNTVEDNDKYPTTLAEFMNLDDENHLIELSRKNFFNKQCEEFASKNKAKIKEFS